MDDIFAEIDIEPRQKRENSKNSHRGSQSEPLPIVPRAPDPVREKFYEMRSLAAKRPFPKSDSELFYRQARFMEDFTDDYGGDAAFNMYFPCYQRMGYDYLRTYFTWRTKVRSGDMQPTYLSYIFLYIYELLSGIGVEKPDDGLAKLMAVWDAFSKQHGAIEKYLPKWLKDYHIFYELPQNFFEFVDRNGLQKHYSLTLMFDTQAGGQLVRWNSISSYDVTKSRFYKDGNAELMSKCFDAVVSEIQGFCEKKGKHFEDMLVYSVSRRQPWQPFKGALFGSRYRQTDREVHISKYERYYCKNGQWTANLPIYYSSQKDFIGYIIKKTEACLRNETGYKYKLAAEMKPGAKPFRELQRTAANRAELDRVIANAVSKFYKDTSRVVVAVDHRSLERIREEALETQEQLIVDDVDSGDIPNVSRSEIMETVPAPPQTLSFSDGWKALKKMLTDTEREALKIALDNPEDINSFAAGVGIMPEVLVDGINEKASDCIGDSVLELSGEVYVFDEYRENLKDILQ